MDETCTGGEKRGKLGLGIDEKVLMQPAEPGSIILIDRRGHRVNWNLLVC